MGILDRKRIEAYSNNLLLKWERGITIASASNKSEFDAIRVGDSYLDVHAINPGGNYYFYAKGVYPSRISKHDTAEGYMLIITYESWYGWNWKIIDFELALA